MKDDWEKTRDRGTHLTMTEIALIRVAFNIGRKPRDIARELQCSSRVAAKYYASFRGGLTRRRSVNIVQRSVPVLTSRFYKSNFEL